MNNTYIISTGKFLPNKAVHNNDIEKHLGLVGNKNSRAKNIVLRQNQIKTRYYAIDANGNITHTNAELAAQAIYNALSYIDLPVQNIELLSCGTSSPDQLLPSHASMVHGSLANAPALEIASLSGVCCSGIHALQYAYQSIKAGLKNNAICTGSELASPSLSSKNFESEYNSLKEIDNNPIIAFEKDFLRFMLSDGAGAFMLSSVPNAHTISLKIEWIESISYAHTLPPCMFQGLDKEGDAFTSWKYMDADDWLKKSVFSVKQDTRLLGENIIKLSFDFAKKCFKKYDLETKNLDYFIPHLSSMYFYNKLQESHFSELGIPIEKWFINLPYVGNVGSASIYLALDELLHSGKLKAGNTILLYIPESGRFSYSFVYLRVV